MTQFELESAYLIKFIYGEDATPLGFAKDDDGNVTEIWYEIPNEDGEWETRCHRIDR